MAVPSSDVWVCGDIFQFLLWFQKFFLLNQVHIERITMWNVPQNNIPQKTFTERVPIFEIEYSVTLVHCSNRKQSLHLNSFLFSLKR